MATLTLIFELVRGIIKGNVHVRALTDEHTDTQTQINGTDLIPSTTDAGGKNKSTVITSLTIIRFFDIIHIAYSRNSLLTWRVTVPC